MDERIPLPEPRFNMEGRRYKHRMLPFSHLTTPPPVHYQEFLEITNAQLKRNVKYLIIVILYLNRLINNKYTLSNRKK